MSSKVYLALQDNDASRYIVAAIEAENPGVSVIYQPAMIRLEREGSLTISRASVEAETGQDWHMQELHLNLITLGGNVDEDDDRMVLSWQR
ncbi:MAG: MmoB/DmpM family protein [Neisseriaceae bacterium]|nr:MmoB/DmpM family protein [Neisseriaceae bacterium]MBP6863115.1 MmoB/DmpM family protein [Neisseriaceae bacterium]